jgi:ribose/xylose/arabinose/galactoside ABC-type transport system permease subunit
VVVVGESLILLTGGLDLSLEATYGLAPMVAAWLIVPVASFGAGTMLNPYLGILSCWRWGWRSVRQRAADREGRLNGFIVTLGMTSCGRHPGRHREGPVPFGLPRPFSYLGSASVGAIPSRSSWRR